MFDYIETSIKNDPVFYYSEENENLKKEQMNLILIIGHTGQGKSTWVKNFLKGRKAYVFDVNNEYPEHPRDTNLDAKKFVSQCLMMQGTNIVFEDATGFFDGRQADETKRLIVQKRHARNNLLFLFHSITDIPPAIARLANYVVLFSTLDEPKTVERKYRMLYTFFYTFHRTKEKSHTYNNSIIYKPQTFKMI